METTRLSSKGQIVLPLSVRKNRKWQPGTQLTVEETEDGVLLRPAKPFPPTTFDEIIAILEKNKYTGKPKTLEEMDAAIANEVRRRRARGRY
jgi:AbrB family looped-hinge helix DNA binding protein